MSVISSNNAKTGDYASGYPVFNAAIMPTSIAATVLAVLICVSALVYPASSLADRIAAFGDSITQGSPYNLFPQNGRTFGGYTPSLNAKINEQQPAVVENWGVSGHTTVDGVARINAILDFRSPDWILIMLGTNDLWGGISVQSTIANLRYMVEKSREKGTEPALANLLPSSVAGHPGYLVPTTYNPRIEELATELSVYFNDVYPLFAANWPILNKDGLHPNIAGYELLATSWCETLPICSEDAEPPPGDRHLSVNMPWLNILLLE